MNSRPSTNSSARICAYVLRRRKHCVGPLLVRLHDHDAGRRTFEARLDDERQVERTRQQRQRPAREIEQVPSGRRQPFGREQFLRKVLVHRERRGFHAAAGIRNGQILEQRLHVTVFTAGPVQRDECDVRFQLAHRVEKAVVVVDRLRFVAQRLQCAQHARSALDRYLALRTAAAHDDRDLRTTFHRRKPRLSELRVVNRHRSGRERPAVRARAA